MVNRPSCSSCSATEHLRTRGSVCFTPAAGRGRPPRGAASGCGTRPCGPGTRCGRGEVFAVNASGDHAGVHPLWLEALALGYRVRGPSLVTRAVHTAPAGRRAASGRGGRGPGDAAGHRAAGTLVHGSDRAVVYGDDVVARYDHGRRVLPRGPGRTKILITADTGWRARWTRPSAPSPTNAARRASTPPRSSSKAIRRRSPKRSPSAWRYCPVCRRRTSGPRRRCAHSTGPARSAPLSRRWRRGRGPGSVRTASPTAWATAVPYCTPPSTWSTGPTLSSRAPNSPSPCVGVAPRSRWDGIAPLRETLVVSAPTHDQVLLDQLPAEPTIANLCIGDHPTHWMAPGCPTTAVCRTS